MSSRDTEHDVCLVQSWVRDSPKYRQSRRLDMETDVLIRQQRTNLIDEAPRVLASEMHHNLPHLPSTEEFLLPRQQKIYK